MLLRHYLLLCCAPVLLAACKPPPKVSVEERDVMTVRQQTERLGGQLIRIVQPGDTLHGISFALGRNVNELAAWNGIRDTSKLQVGQRIRLTEPIGFDARSAQQTATSVKSTNKPSAVKPKPAARPSVKSAPVAVTRAPASQPSPSSVAKAAPVQSRPSTAASNKAWRWPTKGTVVGKFGAGRGHQGIDIRAPKGQSVTAARSGEIVYVGNSLKGYGNLIIVKHDEEYLSAYAHNQDIYVREGQTVKAQQKIATVGTNNKRVAALHFQIRQEGKPVDPLKYLPSS